MIKKFATIFTASLALGACSLGDDYERGNFITNTGAKYSQTERLLTAPNTHSISTWWSRINDPLLNQYVDQLLLDNLALQASAERIIQARETLNITNGNFAPQISSTASAGRSFTPNATTNNRSYTNAYNLGADVSWQIDLFGKIRKSAENNEAQFLATQYDREALTHSLIADLVNRRVAVAANKRRYTLAKKNAENRKTTLDVVQRRYDLGVKETGATDLYLAREKYTTTRADVPRFERAMLDEAYNLDTLLGQTPGSTRPDLHNFTMLPEPLDITTCLPADLLDRRPDLLAAELRTKAANANIGVAIADLYPALNLTGGLGFTGDSGANFFSAEQLAGSILSSITTRLFEGGKLRANIRLRESEAREQAAIYAENILNAFREVESALLNDHNLSQELTQLKASAEALAKAEEIAQERYILGVINLNTFLDTQASHYTAQQALITKEQERWAARIALYLALGGDWFSATNNSCETQTPQNTPDDITEET